MIAKRTKKLYEIKDQNGNLLEKGFYSDIEVKDFPEFIVKSKNKVYGVEEIEWDRTGQDDILRIVSPK